MRNRYATFPAVAKKVPLFLVSPLKDISLLRGRKPTPSERHTVDSTIAKPITTN
jgi:hypothetical protein